MLTPPDWDPENKTGGYQMIFADEQGRPVNGLGILKSASPIPTPERGDKLVATTGYAGPEGGKIATEFVVLTVDNKQGLSSDFTLVRVKAVTPPRPPKTLTHNGTTLF